MERLNVEAEALVLSLPYVKSRFTVKTLMLGKIECKRRRRWQRIRWLDSIIYSMYMNVSKLWEIVKDRKA